MDTLTPDEMETAIELLKKRHTPDGVCADINRENLASMMEGFEAVKTLFRTQKGYADDHPSMVQLDETMAHYKRADITTLGGIAAAVDTPPDKLAEILSRHGYAGVNAGNAHARATALPACWHEVQPKLQSELVRLGIERIKEKISR